MYWQEEDNSGDKPIPDNVLEVVFSINCRTLPLDHAYALSQCVQTALPWFNEEGLAGMHTIHVAESANGWIRPNEPDQVLYPSKRTKFVLRIPKSRSEQTKALLGQTFLVNGHTLTMTKAKTRKLSDITTLFSRYVVSQSAESESEFLERMVAELKAMHIQPKKMLCGIIHSLQTSQADILARSLLLAELSLDESIVLQEHGLGSHRYMGCGLFIPHKEVSQISENLG